MTEQAMMTPAELWTALEAGRAENKAMRERTTVLLEAVSAVQQSATGFLACLDEDELPPVDFFKALHRLQVEAARLREIPA